MALDLSYICAVTAAALLAVRYRPEAVLLGISSGDGRDSLSSVTLRAHADREQEAKCFVMRNEDSLGLIGSTPEVCQHLPLMAHLAPPPANSCKRPQHLQHPHRPS